MHETSMISTFSEQETEPTLEEMIASLASSMKPCRDLLAAFDAACERTSGAIRSLGEALVEGEVIEANRVGIELAGGGIAWVSPEDYDELSRCCWYKTLNGPRSTAKKEYVFRWERRDGKRIKVYLHRHLLGLEPGDKRTIDHINGDTLDCTRGNIRVATTAQNCRNRKKQSSYGNSPTSSRYKGVVRIKSQDLWKSRICKDGRQHFLGNFTDPKLAAIAYDAKARELFGEFASLNLDAHPELLTVGPEGRA